METTNICAHCCKHNNIDHTRLTRVHNQTCEICRNNCLFMYSINDEHYNIKDLTTTPTTSEIIQDLTERIEMLEKSAKRIKELT